MRHPQKRKRSKAHSEAQREKNASLVIAAHQEYLDVDRRYLDKVKGTLVLLKQRGFVRELDVSRKLEIEGFMAHAERQIDQIRRRVILGEVIFHDEKVFSIFEPHTEWISKGKAGVPVELAVKVCLLEDQYRFILHHQVMQKQTDDQVDVPMVEGAKKRLAQLVACSFDKGFHSTANQITLQDHLTLVALPRKGKLSQSAQEIEQSAGFVNARRAHSAVESAINALELHGLDICQDQGIVGFKRYVAWAVVARNLYRIGVLLWQQEQLRALITGNRSEHDPPLRQAA